MISLHLGRHEARDPRRDRRWASLLVAVALTGTWLVGLSLAWRHEASSTTPVATYDPEPRREAVIRLEVPAPAIVQPRPVTAEPPDRAALLHRAPRADVAAPRRDTGGTPPITTPPTSPAPSAQLAPMAPAFTRLLPSSAGTPWYSAPRAHDPFVRNEQGSREDRDSALGALGAQVPELAMRRVPSHGERDALAKTAMLKMRLSGRILLVPPDNSGGTITASLPLPFLGARGPSRVARPRDSVAGTAGREIQERLRHRADSLRAARSDSMTKSLVAP